jgi:hypothetical protein
MAITTLAEIMPSMGTTAMPNPLLHAGLLQSQGGAFYPFKNQTDNATMLRNHAPSLSLHGEKNQDGIEAQAADLPIASSAKIVQVTEPTVRP